MSLSTDLRQNREFAFELKFLVNPALAGQIREWTRARLVPDPNGSGGTGDTYRITSLYFDTDRFDVFHGRGSFGRSKYRIRRYGPAAIAFLERKLKTRGLVTKRRSAVATGELERLANGQLDRNWPGYWFHQRIRARQLRPVCQITYRRTARVSMAGDGPVRVTIDDDLRALPACGPAFNPAEGGPRLSEPRVILELKYRHEAPVLFKRLIEEFVLNPQPVSKYRLAIVALGLVDVPPPAAPAYGQVQTCACLSS